MSNLGPAAGIKDESASQPRREAAFWHVAEDWGLGEFLPRCDLIGIDGTEYAVQQLLPFDFKTMEKHRKAEPSLPQRALRPYLVNGTLHKWAAMDYILGNTDRHGQNVMMGPNEEVKLIDHGSAFAGRNFDPGHDQYSFVPYYLRAWAPQQFNALSSEDKLKALPRLSGPSEQVLKSWLQQLDEHRLAAVLLRYGINPAPSVERLVKLKAMLQTEASDLAVNQSWVM